MIHIKAIINRIFTSNTFIISCDESNCIWLVDAGDIQSIIAGIPSNSLVCGVFLTHAHFDHIYGLNDLLKQFPDALVYTNECGKEGLLNARKNMSFYHETPFVFEYPENIRIVNDGDEIELSEGLKAQVVSTPGHHPSCLSYIIDDAIFTGDSYIPGTKVVTNLPRGDKRQAQESLEKIMQLSKTLTVYPGHYIEQ